MEIVNWFVDLQLTVWAVGLTGLLIIGIRVGLREFRSWLQRNSDNVQCPTEQRGCFNEPG